MDALLKYKELTAAAFYALVYNTNNKEQRFHCNNCAHDNNLIMNDPQDPKYWAIIINWTLCVSYYLPKAV